jgi:hypothetical protein
MDTGLRRYDEPGVAGDVTRDEEKGIGPGLRRGDGEGGDVGRGEIHTATATPLV